MAKCYLEMEFDPPLYGDDAVELLENLGLTIPKSAESQNRASREPAESPVSTQATSAGLSSETRAGQPNRQERS